MGSLLLLGESPEEVPLQTGGGREGDFDCNISCKSLVVSECMSGDRPNLSITLSVVHYNTKKEANIENLIMILISSCLYSETCLFQ